MTPTAGRATQANDCGGSTSVGAARRLAGGVLEPKNSAALLGKEPGLHQIQGIGDGFIPPVLDVSLIDDVEVVADQDAIETARALARKAGLLVGTSLGRQRLGGFPSLSQAGRGTPRGHSPS